MNDTDRIRDVVAETMHSYLDPMSVVSVTVTPDVDAQGDEIVWVDVVYRGDPASLDPERAMQAKMSIWNRLYYQGDCAFPVLSLIAESDTSGMRSEAA